MDVVVQPRLRMARMRAPSRRSRSEAPKRSVGLVEGLLFCLFQEDIDGI